MEKTLILTGWSYLEYALSAALVLQHFKKADILGMSKRRLPEFLEKPGDYSRIVILGVSILGNVKRLGKALASLKRRKVEVTWFSSYPIPDVPDIEEVRANLEVCIDTTRSLADLIAKFYHLDASKTAPFCDSQTPLGKKYHELLEAAGYFYRNFQKQEPYSTAIRHIAALDPEAKWTQDERDMLTHYRRYGRREIIGKSDAIMELQEKISLVAPYDHARVLIQGESGTGKESVAEMIHQKSPRKDQEFVAFNCASINPSLLESAFLGHEKGAFTDAKERRIGCFEQANGGTLFLDEIGELSQEVQGVLLRVLQEGRFMRIGGAEELKVDVRVISATNRDLPAMVREGAFRLDLYERLCTVQIRTPPLREHKDDIPLLAKNFRCHNGIEGRLSPDQIEALKSYDYPGNVRELNHLLERAAIFGTTDYYQLIQEHRRLNAGLYAENGPAAEAEELPDNLEEAKKLHIRRVYEKYGRNISKAAEKLDISRNTMRTYLN